jgi:hypothetical protein
MFRTMLSRRRREDARVDAFLSAIELSATYTLDPRWELQRVEDDAHPLPLQLVAIMVPAAGQ